MKNTILFTSMMSLLCLFSCKTSEKLIFEFTENDRAKIYSPKPEDKVKLKQLLSEEVLILAGGGMHPHFLDVYQPALMKIQAKLAKQNINASVHLDSAFEPDPLVAKMSASGVDTTAIIVFQESLNMLTSSQPAAKILKTEEKNIKRYSTIFTLMVMKNKAIHYAKCTEFIKSSMPLKDNKKFKKKLKKQIISEINDLIE